MTRIWERIRDWVLLGSLLMVSVVTLLTANDPMYRGLRARSLEATSAVETLFAGIGRYFRAIEENEALRERNVLLNNEVAQMREALVENRELKDLLGLRDSVYTDLVAARVISKDITRERNLIVLDVGRRDGIAEGMAVVDERGIVGKTLLVTDRFTQVMTFQNTDFYVPARILPSGSDGMIRWDGERFGTLLMELVERTASVNVGDRVVAGPSDIFHSATPIGVIDTVMVPPGAPTLAIRVQPFSRIDDLTHVFVDRSRPVSSQIPFNP
jgi:rod shape-determining protein MreC